jgi:hypothetical protein
MNYDAWLEQPYHEQARLAQEQEEQEFDRWKFSKRETWQVEMRHMANLLNIIAGTLDGPSNRLMEKLSDAEIEDYLADLKSLVEEMADE